MVKYYKTPSIVIQFATVGQLRRLVKCYEDQNYFIFEVFVDSKNEITNILETKSVIYIKLPYIQQLLEEYYLPIPP